MKVFLTLNFVIFMILDINRKWASNSRGGNNFDGKHANMQWIYQWCSLKVTETMSRGVSHKTVALLDICSDAQSSTSEYVAAVCTETGVIAITDVPELKRLWLAENHSNVSQIAGAALMNSPKDLPVCDTSLG